MKFDIVKRLEASNSFRVLSVMGQFDLQSRKVCEHFKGDLDMEGLNWNVGVIYGASGTGKSTIANYLWPNDYIRSFHYSDKAVIEEMPADLETREITRVFNSVGFATVWSWLKPYDVLSTGEKMRVDLARAILEKRDLIVFDEFTSVVNREVACVSSYAISRAVRKMNKKFIAVTCHRDILNWLEPDWSFCTDDMSFSKKNFRGQKLNCKSIDVERMCGNFLSAIII